MTYHLKPARKIIWLEFSVFGIVTWLALPTSLRMRLEPVAHAATFAVTNTNDDALCKQGANQSDNRVRVVRALIDDSTFSASQYNPAFVLMQYFGYLRRQPEQGGYDFWLNVLNKREPNNYRGMVCAFITSAEYQHRFGQLLTRSNRDCGP